MAARGEEDVVRLDVPVDDASGRARRPGCRAPRSDPQHLPDRQAVRTRKLEDAREGLAFEPFHHEERRAVLGGVVVQDGDGPWMPDLVRDVPLALEARDDVLGRREERVHHLDRDPLAVRAVRPLVDRGRPPGADHRAEHPLVVRTVVPTRA